MLKRISSAYFWVPIAVIVTLALTLNVNVQLSSIAPTLGNTFSDLQQHHRQLLEASISTSDHCTLTRGDWCGLYYAQEPVPVKPAPRGSKTCPNDCNGIGNCHADYGICFCPAGYDGLDCSKPNKRPCLHMQPDKRDIGFTLKPEWSHTRCAGICDDDWAMCWCPPEMKYGHVPAPAGSPPHAPPLKMGRPLFWCHPSDDGHGNKVTWGSVPYAHLFNKSMGWCEADLPAFRCPCRIDGLIGELCNIPVEQYCVNQCSGHGICNQGFCKCHTGWYGHDCSRKVAGLQMEPGDHRAGKPWLGPAIMDVVAAEEPIKLASRKRPFIYVYDLRGEFSTDIMQYRIERGHCTFRNFGFGNNSDFIGYNAYAIESMLHELLLGSEHRTFDPEEADYFYVPAYSNCLFDVYGWNARPQWPPGTHGPRPMGAANMLKETQAWIARTYPFWNRTGGRDHIFLMAHDEGACYAPIQIWNATMLTHWGKLDWPHTSHTSYWPDNYTNDMIHQTMPKGWLHYTSKAHPCYDPQKDLIIPVFKQPDHYSGSVFLGRSPPKRDILLSFKGDIGIWREKFSGCLYSRCVRQRLYNLTKANNWDKLYNVMIGDSQELNRVPYSDLLSRSVFCLVAAGDGWSARFEDCTLHGAIPVIVLDNTHGPFETMLDWPSFSVRVKESELPRMMEVLQAITPAKREEMLANVAKMWHRMRYNSHKMCLKSSANWVSQRRREATTGIPQYILDARTKAEHGTDDAFGMILQWLYHKMPTKSAQVLRQDRV